MPVRSAASPKPEKNKSLESWIWDAACSIRGAKDAPKYKDYILPLVFTKHLCDVFDDELNRIAKEVGSRKKAFQLAKADHKLVRFYLPLVPDDPEQPVWSVIRKLSDKIGEGVTSHMRAIARENPLLQGIIDRVDFNATTHGQRDLDDDRLSNLIEAVSTKRLGLDDVEADIIGKSYEYLIRKFAEGGGQSAGEFYTPPEVGTIMSRVLQPEPGMEIYDPTCGSGGLLVKCEIEKERRADIPVRQSKGKGGLENPPSAPLKLFGQEYVPETWAMANMNMIIHDMEGQIEIGDTFKNPKFRDKGGKLRTFDRVVANPMWNQDWFTEADYDADELGRFPAGAGFPGKSSADWGWVQHMHASLNDKGRAAVVLDTGAASRGSGNAGTNKEKTVRQWFVDHEFFDHEEKRERDLILIDYDDPANNVYEVTEEWAFHNGHYGTREDVVFLINGIPVLVIECKNASKDEAIALGVDQIRRYHRETPELFVPQQLFTATDAIGFSYGVSWNTVRRNIFNWKDEEVGKLEAKVKSFCAIPQVLAFLKDYIVFAEKDEELNKYILRQHQTGAVEATVCRALDPQRTRGLVWHTQGSGKTFTMIKAAERLFRAPEADKPTVLLMIDRNELEDQMLKNLAALGLGNLEHAGSIRRLNQLLRDDYRGIIVTMIHKFRDMPANLNLRKNIYVLIDEAHRTTGGDLGNFLMAGLPNATFLGFTGTPVDKTVFGKGTFKTFGCEDDQGYLHKYSIADSIEDGTTLPLYYQLAPNEMLVPHETLDKEFLSLAEAEGVADIEELNKILERAVNLKNFLKGKDRIQKVAKFVAEHYRENVEPVGYKAFLVGVDREACAHYKHALDQFLPPGYSEVVYTGSNNDSALLKEFHLDPKKERQIRKSFGKLDQQPKILIVTEKLLTGFDAPVLYAMYLDKPMRDHTLLQAIARVNRPYENEAQEMVKPHGFVLDFVGIFDKLEKALAFDSDEINAIVKDLKLLKVLFKNKMESKAPAYLGLIERNFNDKDVDTLIEHFRDPERRKEFFREYKEIEMLYEIISPDAFLRPFMEDYTTLSAIYDVVRKAYTKQVMVDRDFQRKTNALVQDHVGGYTAPSGPLDLVKIDGNTIELIKKKRGGDGTKVINLVKSIEKAAEENSDDPFLIAMAERARAVQESFEQRQTATADALEELIKEVERNEARKKEQAGKGFDELTFFVYRTLLDAKVTDAEAVSGRIKAAFVEFPHWKRSEAALRELRKKVTFAIYAEMDDLNTVTRLVDDLFRILEKEGSP